MQTRGSRFIKFQEVRIQELAGEVRRLCVALFTSEQLRLCFKMQLPGLQLPEH